ncbi:sulfite exporter TauE/SafE [Sinorhizobium medicae]|uniref:TSUP family transporter n=1 Tax=Sinorhizobium medicae TaxID=110321 RepID=UPI0011AC8C77|nr:TSUP family transporter [Sinorhizobium medicae]TWA26199.1 sulfite exporter TauE/SafE [Sinorhizobium medicae]
MISMAGCAAFMVLSMIAAYVQTLTGFAFGLLLMGGIALTGLMPLPDAAIVISLLTLANAAVVMGSGWRDIARKPLLLSLAGAIPMIVVGYVLLDVLASTSLSMLRLTLGVVIILSGLQLVLRLAPVPRMSPAPAFVLYGGLGGLMGGLFSTAGPPLVFQFYRQPMPYVVIRETLVTIFAINSLFRLGIVAASRDWQPYALLWASVGLPAVLVATVLARRWPPTLSPRALRLAVFILLFLSGASLILPALSDI